MLVEGYDQGIGFAADDGDQPIAIDEGGARDPPCRHAGIVVSAIVLLPHHLAGLDVQA